MRIATPACALVRNDRGSRHLATFDEIAQFQKILGGPVALPHIIFQLGLSVQCLIQVGDQIIGIFQAHAHAKQGVRDAEL